jgi:hypothetical protein
VSVSGMFFFLPNSFTFQRKKTDQACRAR